MFIGVSALTGLYKTLHNAKEYSSKKVEVEKKITVAALVNAFALIDEYHHAIYTFKNLGASKTEQHEDMFGKNCEKGNHETPDIQLVESDPTFSKTKTKTPVDQMKSNIPIVRYVILKTIFK